MSLEKKLHNACMSHKKKSPRTLLKSSAIDEQAMVTIINRRTLLVPTQSTITLVPIIDSQSNYTARIAMLIFTKNVDSSRCFIK